MKLTRGISSIILLIGVIALLALNFFSQRSLHEARADRADWETEKANLEDSLARLGEDLTALRESSLLREKELLETIQRQTDERHELTESLAASTARERTLETSKAKLDKVILDANAKLAELETARAELEKSASEAITELEQKRQEYAGLSENLAAVRVLTEKLESRAAKLEELATASHARLIASFDELNGKIEENTRLEAELATARLRRIALEAEVRRLLDTTSATPDSIEPPPQPENPVKGKIAAINAKESIVVVNVGEKAGLGKGMLLDVLAADGKSTLATLRVAEVFADYSGCDIVKGEVSSLEIELPVVSER